LCLCGNNITLKVEPIALAGRFFANLAKTAPPLPCDLEILPQLVLKDFPDFDTETTLFPK
jgi:hypothetical protein